MTSDESAVMMLEAFPEEPLADLLGGSVVICSGEPGNPVISVTDNFTKHTGYGRHEVLGKNLGILQGPDTSPEAVEMFRFLMRTGQPGKIKILNYRKDRTAFWHICDLRPIKNADNRITHFICVQRPLRPE
jgi:PAS domain S-box-containing protein